MSSREDELFNQWKAEVLPSILGDAFDFKRKALLQSTYTGVFTLFSPTGRHIPNAPDVDPPKYKP